jgi:transcriptional regulator with XRE-family HTH domain
MVGLSKKKKDKARAKVHDPELAAKVKELRNGLGLYQAQFADRLTVSRTQIVGWEQGATERPSVEKLLEMAQLAPTAEARKWFWRKAGLNLDVLRADFREEAGKLTEAWNSGQALRVPIVPESKVGAHGELLETEDGSLMLPIERFLHPASVVCLKCKRRPPWIITDGDLVIVDKSVMHFHKLRRTMAAVLFDPFPVPDDSFLLKGVLSRSLSLLRQNSILLDPVVSRSLDLTHKNRRSPKWDESNELEHDAQVRLLEQSSRPGLLFGWLDVKYESNERSRVTQTKKDPWCLVLQVQSPMSPFATEISLSDWETSSGPEDYDDGMRFELLLHKSVRILGEVIGWIGTQPGPSPNDVSVLKSER